MDQIIEELYQKELDMYPHLKNIRDRLWMKDGKGRVSVMVGAGFSLNAEKVEDSIEGMSTWLDVKKRLLKDLNHHRNLEYKDVLEIGQKYSEEYGRASLDELLKEVIPDNNYEPSYIHHNLLRLPWTDIYTTNYDTLLERARNTVYERNYQIVYDMNDIPNSVSPRIIKLHGSFPSNRPFVFTKQDYENYPQKFSPFVNMVQQSIMETTFVLLGFSGDDPNFEKWTTWVSDNLGEHMPKIYMIGYGQKGKIVDLEKKGITLIDFKNVYKNFENPYSHMFKDLFEFLEYKEREEKTKWPHKSYENNNTNDFFEVLKYNRNNYPGWIIIPDEIRRKYAIRIRSHGENFLENFDDEIISKDTIEKIYELMWCYEKFYIPLDYRNQKKFQKIIDKQIVLDESLIFLVLLLMKEARLDCNKEDFEKYKLLLQELFLTKDQKHHLDYEIIQYYLTFNNLEVLQEYLHRWIISPKEIEWGIKKAVILEKINYKEKAKEMFEHYLQRIRQLLVINIDDYKLLSLESIALNNYNRIKQNGYYGYDRLRFLDEYFCDCIKQFHRTILSINKYEYSLGKKEKKGFDPKSINSSVSYGDYMKQNILDSFAVSQIDDLYGLSINDLEKYKLAIENLKIIYSCYSYIKRITKSEIKELDNILSREYVYKINDYHLINMFNFFNNSLSNEKDLNLNINLILEATSRIYFALDSSSQNEIDQKIIEYIKLKKDYSIEDKQTLEKLIKRICINKNKKNLQTFIGNLMNINIISQDKIDSAHYLVTFFEPTLIFFDNVSNVYNISISEEKLDILFKNLLCNEPYSFREAALIRLTFLNQTNSLSQEKTKKFKNTIKGLSQDRRYGLSDFLFAHVFNELIDSNPIVIEKYNEFLDSNIPIIYKDNHFFNFHFFKSYFVEVNNIFVGYILNTDENTPDEEKYKVWLEKFYIWWQHQKEGLLQNENRIVGLNFNLQEYLLIIIQTLRNHILGVVPERALNEKHKNLILQIFLDINQKNFDISFYLLPSLIRLKIELKYSLNYILENLSNENHELVKISISILYDYLIFIDKNEIIDSSNIIKNELFNIMKYGSTEKKIEVTNMICYTMENRSSIFTDGDYNFFIQYSNNYLNTIKTKDMESFTIDDFELISNIAGIVGYTFKNNLKIIGDSLNDWKDYIYKHRLPEVKKYINLLT